MALTERQKIARQGKLTGSRIGALMSGDPEAMYDLWLELTGDPSFTPPDFSNVWPVQLGNATEQLHLDWLQRGVGEIDCRGDVVTHKSIPWAAVTLDGWCKRDGCAVETKHVGGWESTEVILDRYMPQLHWTMLCTGTNEIIFSLIAGAKEPQPMQIMANEQYGFELMTQAEAFMDCVFNLREPVPNPYIKPPKAEYVGIKDMSGSNTWGVMAAQWKDHKTAAALFQSAAVGLKELVPPDAKEAFGHGIRAKRNKKGALTIKLESDYGQDEGSSD